MNYANNNCYFPGNGEIYGVSLKSESLNFDHNNVTTTQTSQTPVSSKPKPKKPRKPRTKRTTPITKNCASSSSSTPNANKILSYKCSICKKTFPTKAEVHSHARMHKDGRNFKCCFCNKAFSTQSYLTQHERIHKNIKPYKCDLCNKAFTQLSHMQQHRRLHTGEKPFKCPYDDCDKAFAQLANLNHHKRTHERKIARLQLGGSGKGVTKNGSKGSKNGTSRSLISTGNSNKNDLSSLLTSSKASDRAHLYHDYNWKISTAAASAAAAAASSSSTFSNEFLNALAMNDLYGINGLNLLTATTPMNNLNLVNEPQFNLPVQNSNTNGQSNNDNNNLLLPAVYNVFQ